ncbi:membrane protein [Corynebacterium phocae]|uniref:Membrane protein n=1 Tax=Corynebacterium phocae TaxID=161895 RepID=A0A1L7D117_9CORY|nr:MarP family serine protease [Corynebacterium phocae]APT91753.1 membrane protein [Corynebacterium phocae]KAA8728517.1 MarP family serine protease [Corynebacterium phocae]
MNPALIVDGIIVIGALLAWLSGWRQGAVSSLLSFVGIVAGLVIGAGVAPFVLELTDHVALRFLLVVGLLMLLGGVGQLAGTALGTRLREKMKARSHQTWDSFVGGVFQVVALLAVAWLVSLPLASGLSGKAGLGVRESTVLGALNRNMPQGINNVPAEIAGMLNETGLPPLVSPWITQGTVEVEQPRIEVQDRALIERLRPSVVHVLGDADACSRRLMGSGFVAREDYVITNAHVVAGTNVVALDTVLGVKEAEVVYYNPDVDIAVLHSPKLGIAPLPWAVEPAESGQEAVVMGYPLSGPFTATPARIRERLIIAGPDIYADGRVERDAYTLRGQIQQGNSGGPMINAQGEVLGVIFGASVDDTDTGYALTANEVLGHVGEYWTLTQPVPTGECVTR